MSDLREGLAALEQTLRDLGSPVLNHVRPGAEADVVKDTLASRDITPHPDIITWFGWHDGTDQPRSTDPPGGLLPVDGNRLIGNLHLPGLDEALFEHDRAIAGERKFNTDLDNPWFYWPGWFPVLRFTDSWAVCVDTLGTAGPVGTLFVHDVHDVHVDNDPPRAFFPSLRALVDAVIDAFATGQVSPTQSVIDPADLPPSAGALNY